MSGILDGRVAIVTGGGRGIGFAVALAMARQGARVLVNDDGVRFDGTDSNPSIAKQAVAAIRAEGGVAEADSHDVSRTDGVQAMLARCLDAFGTVDILYNNAGFVRPVRLIDMTDDEFDRTFDVSVKGTFLATKAVLPIMKARGWGRIINVSSPGGLWGSPLQAHRGASKGGVHSFTSVVSKELWEFGITVNCVVLNAPTRELPPEVAAVQRAEGAKWLRPGLVAAGAPTTDNTAQVVTYLASEACGDITGRTVFIAGDTLGECTEVTLTNTMTWPHGWTYGALARHFHHVVPCGPAAPYVGDRAPNLAARRSPPAPAAIRAWESRSVHQPPDLSPGRAGGPGLLDRLVVAITGAGHGIGMIAAVEMARQGARVLVNNRSAANGRAVVDRIRAEGGTAELTLSDVSTRAGAEQVIDDCVRHFGRIDVLYNNAGYIWPDPLERMTEEQFDDLMNVHVRGSVWCTRAALAHMVRQGFGRILLTGSPGGYAHASPWAANYGTAKGALTALARCLYKEVYEDGITVNVVVPNAPTTRRTPEEKRRLAAPTLRWGRFGFQPMNSVGPPTLEKIAPFLAWCVSDQMSDVTGRTLFVGGEKIGLYRDPELINVLAPEGGWDYARLERLFRAVIPSGPPSPFYADDPALIAAGGF